MAIRSYRFGNKKSGFLMMTGDGKRQRIKFDGKYSMPVKDATKFEMAIRGIVADLETAVPASARKPKMLLTASQGRLQNLDPGHPLDQRRGTTADGLPPPPVVTVNVKDAMIESAQQAEEQASASLEEYLGQHPSHIPISSEEVPAS